MSDEKEADRLRRKKRPRPTSPRERREEDGF